MDELIVKHITPQTTTRGPLNKALRRLAKAAESTVRKALLLDQEVKGLRTANAKQKKKVQFLGLILLLGLF